MKETFMREAIRLALDNMHAGKGGPFGAVIVQNNKIIGRGHNQVTSSCDPTAHAEINAIREACKNLQTFSLANCEIYTSCEPCPMCLGAIYWARLDTIYFAANRQDASDIGFDDNFFYQEVSKPIDERTVPMKELLREEALVPFQEWENKADKIRY